MSSDLTTKLALNQQLAECRLRASPVPLIVLIHGGALSSRMFHTMIPDLKERGFDIATPDLPGHGASVSLGPFSFERSRTLISAALREHRKDHPEQPVVLVGVSLGGQVVLDLLQHEPKIAAAAVVSGVSIGPPDERAQWEMPHMPTDEGWLKIIEEDVAIVGMDKAQEIQTASLGFTFNPSASEKLPPVLVVIGEEDVNMALRDQLPIVQRIRSAGGKSRAAVLKRAWHNHPIDAPGQFSQVTAAWLVEVEILNNDGLGMPF